MRHASTGQRTTTTGERYRGRLALIGLLSLSLVTAGSSSLASGPSDGPTDVAAVEASQPRPVSPEAGTAATDPALEDEPATPEVPAPRSDADPALEPTSAPVDGADDVAVDGDEAQPVEDGQAATDDDAVAHDGEVEDGDSTPVEDDTDTGQATDRETEDPGAVEPEPARVAPMAVPRPTGNDAVITVQVGGDRTGTSSVAGLAGVTLRLYDGTGAPTHPVEADWATCVSDAAGDCSFTVPETQAEVREQGRCIREGWILWPIFWDCVEWEQIHHPAGVNRDRQFWVVQESTPDGWYTNPTLVTGETAHGTTEYRVRTGSQLRARNTYRSGSNFMTAATWTGSFAETDSSGTWQVSRANPRLAPTCESGLNVALVLDLSGSVSDSLPELKDSAVGFASALRGTGSNLALFTFADDAPRSSTNQGRNWPLTAVDGSFDTITSRINAYQSGGGTNWDRGIWQVAQSNEHFDLAIVITDGQATYAGSSIGSGRHTRFIETEHAIFSANALKAEGTRVLAVGVGDGIDGDAANLRAVSGPNPHTPGASANSADFFQTGWHQLAPLLENLAKGATCQASITVDKVVQPYGGETGPGAGWAFVADRTGDGEIAPSGAQLTGASGSVEYTLRFDRPDAVAATVRIEERATAGQRADGWSLSDIRCTVNGDQQATSRDGDAVVLREIAAGDDVACTFTNTQTLEPSIVVEKRAWNVTSADDLDDAVEIDAGTTVPTGTVVTWTYEVRNTGQTRLLDIVVTDDQDVTVTCPYRELAPDRHMVCTGSGPVTPTGP